MSSAVSSPLGAFLTGIRVLDLSQYIPGPMATLLLSDMGADVLKIEPPQGDAMQTLGPRDREGRPTFYRALNAGKTVQRMNLKLADQRAAFLDLVRDADVVVEGFRPGVMTRLGVDYSVLSAINPGLVMCSISGYGADTTLGRKAGHDANYLALTGVMHRNGAQAPQFYDPPLADVAGSLFAALSILGALHGRYRTGKGCAIDLALADAVMPLQLIQVADYGANGTVPERGMTYLNGGAAFYQVYATADRRHVVLGAIEPKFWQAFCNAAARPDLIDRQDEQMPQTALQADVAAIFAEMSLAEATVRFSDVDCCLSRVDDLGEALGSTHIDERKLVQRSDGGDLQALFPAWVDGTPPAPRADLKPAPTHDLPTEKPAANAALKPPQDVNLNIQTGKK
jgi:alpha-methylacyl-CoA racemase